MKNKMVSVSVLITILMFLINLTVFAQNQPEKKDTKANNQFTTTHVQQHGKTITNQQTQNQKEMKNTNNKMTSDEQKDHASVSKDNQNKESVNTHYHKKQGTTKEQQKQIKKPTKGGNIE